MAKVSIIIPVYNVEKYLDKCVQSAINQTLQNIEIILVDDESPDNCPQMCDEYAKKDSRIKVVHKKNGGLGFARNFGLEVAAGEYVTFLDSDDFVDLYTYEHLYNLAVKNSLDAIYYKYTRFTKEDEVVPSQPNNDITKYCDEDVKGLMLDIIASEPSAKVDHKIQCSSCTAMYRTSIVKENNVRFHSERELISEDLIFNLDYLKHAQKVAFNNGEHYHYRVNLASLTSAIRADRLEKIYLLYNYVNDNLSYWGLPIPKGEERNKRLLLGGCRNAIYKYTTSNISNQEKSQWLHIQTKRQFWTEIKYSYNWKALPTYPKISFILCYKQNIFLLKLLCKMKHLVTNFTK